MSANGTNGGLDDLLRATFARYRPDPFVGPESLARMRRLGAALPGNATAFFGFECRLGGAPPEADLLVCVAAEDGGAAALATGLERAPPGPHPFWPRLAAFCRAWADPAGPWRDVVHNIWLEFDLADTAEDGAVPVPAVFTGTEALTADAGPAAADRVSDALDALAGAEPSPRRRAALRRALAALPPGGSLFQLGVMLSRGDDRVRVCAAGLGAAALDRYLADLGRPDPGGSRAAFLAAVAPFLAEVRVGLDASPDGIGRRIGFECYGGLGPGDAPRWAALIRWLREGGLCTVGEAEAMTAWWGLSHRRLLRNDWPDWTDRHPGRPAEGGPGALWRTLHHVKVTLDPPGPMAAKAYLASHLVWPTDATVRALAAAVAVPAIPGAA